MNTVVTSKEKILKTSRELIQQQGWSAVSIRSVAAACGVSVGSIYNYFDSKATLVGATVESVWCEIFHRRKISLCFKIRRPVLSGCMREWNMAVSSIPASLPSTQWDSCGRISWMGSGGCSRLGTIFQRDCVLS